MMRGWKAWVVVLALLALGGGTLLWRQRQPGVAVTLDPAFVALGHPKRTVTLDLRASAGKLASVEAQVVQGGVAHPLLTEDLAAAGVSEARRPLTLAAPALGLKEGPAELLVFDGTVEELRISLAKCD